MCLIQYELKFEPYGDYCANSGSKEQATLTPLPFIESTANSILLLAVGRVEPPGTIITFPTFRTPIKD